MDADLTYYGMKRPAMLLRPAAPAADDLYRAVLDGVARRQVGAQFGQRLCAGDYIMSGSFTRQFSLAASVA
jgi:hypothetical protein